MNMKPLSSAVRNGRGKNSLTGIEKLLEEILGAFCIIVYLNLEY